jgi:molybdate transport system regulatory protein
VDFTDWCSIGIGKIELLESIQRCGSLSKAARDLGMSYRRAWLLVDSMNCEFNVPLVSAAAGGSGGGGAALTPLGKQLVQAYRKLEGKLALVVGQQMRVIARHVSPQDQRRPNRGGGFSQSIAKPLAPRTS